MRSGSREMTGFCDAMEDVAMRSESREMIGLRDAMEDVVES